MQFLKFALLLSLMLLPEPVPAWKADTVKVWARAIGSELWKLSEALTKSDQIRIKYKQMNASVKRKDGTQILESTLRSVSNMLNRKIKAVKCIHAKAEELAKNFNYSQVDDDYEIKYCSAKYSKFNYEPAEQNKTRDDPLFTPNFTINNTDYVEVGLEKDSHFYNINVNTNISCVHVPTNIFYKEKEALNAILWSKGLNDVFTKNYKSDPSLVWQYFGSAHGILRFYPGMPWNKKEVDTYDCRVKSWYIEAATCSKDVIILFDVSGSMTGFKNYVARRTLRSLLETLSNNDYVNVYTYNKDVRVVVECFEHLVQATPENLKTLSDTLEPKQDPKQKKKVMKHKVPLEGTANLTEAYTRAFNELRGRRKNCNVSSTQGCNQLVMVITDYVPGNLTEVFEEYNREVVAGKTYIPVRVFTYLIGKEVTNVDEIRWMACQNRGYFVHIHSVEEVQQQVLKYINVIARPMILEESEPLPTWTHANIDYTRTGSWGVSDDVGKPDEDKLVTSVAIPAFDYNSEDAGLLGVAGTDVPIDSIAKLAQPHQLGVNGYSFIVSNNGYLLLHPLLITSINGKLQENYNSVDFVEVEQVDDGKGSREYGYEIKTLRENLVNGSNGNMTHVKVLYHYDKMRRIDRVKHDYFFNALEGTPFSMGISLPMGYGDTELLLKDNPLEAKRGKVLTGINVTDYFRTSFRVHPDWVYCKYHYLEGHETPNAEEEIWAFLVGLSHNKIDITKKQYADIPQNFTFDSNQHCGSGETGTDDYYCTEDLVKQLVFDAKLSTPYFQNWTATKEQWDLAAKYNVTVRFIATSSGLTRWHYIFDTDKNEQVHDNGTRSRKYPGKVFGDVYYNAIEQTWYQAAVLQHMIHNPESLVISTPLPILDEIIKTPSPVINDDGDIIITASLAIFYKDGNSSTPASVVGFQYSYQQFYERFLRLTNITLDGTKDPTCDPDSNEYECYIIDGSGYIVLAKDIKLVGNFFGTQQKYVLQSFLDKGIFDHVEMFNYQALCPPQLFDEEKSSSWPLQTPFSLMSNFFHWLVTEVLLLLFNWKNYSYASALFDPDYSDTPYSAPEPTTSEPPPETANETIPPKEVKGEPFSCDHSITLYILNQKYFSDASGNSPTVIEDKPGNCHPAYWAAYIPKTNLLLVVVEKNDGEYSENCKIPLDTKPKPTHNSTNRREPCHKLDLAGFPRRRLAGCYTYHDGERNITACGMGSVFRGDWLVLVTAVLLAVTTAWSTS